jgi:hypothetical protein
MMNPRRFATMAALCGTLVLTVWVLARPAGSRSAGMGNTAVPIEDRPAPFITASLTADVKLVDPPQATAPQVTEPQTTAPQATAPQATAPQATAPQTTAPQATAPEATAPQATAVGSPAVADATVADADVATAAESVTGTASDTTAASDTPESIVAAAVPDSPPQLSPEIPPVQVATASTPDPVPDVAKEAVSSIDIPEECPQADTCVDRYLWALYQRTPKLDAITEHDRRKVTVRKRGRTVTVTKSFARVIDEDFAWKDPKAAEKAGMAMMDYVIGGMDPDFKLKLFHVLRAAEEAGLSPGITSGFRDDYRQSIASGLKAANDRSYHGGSFRGGYGHGLAADAVSVKGATKEERRISTEVFWKWIDAHGEEFGIGRPYLNMDPPHLAPIDGKEYADHHHGTKAQHAGSDMKKRHRLAMRNDRSMAKRLRTARSSKGRTI